MTPAEWTTLVLLILAFVLAFLTYSLAEKGLSELLLRTVTVPGGVVFFRRAFLLMLIYGAVAQAVGANPNLKPGAAFMEYVWAVAGGLQNCLGFLFLTLAIYLILMTVLLAALKPKDDK